MAKRSHSGKNSSDKQLYFDAITHLAGDLTVPDEALKPSPFETDVPQEPDRTSIKAPPRKRRRRKSGIAAHIQKNLATYIVLLATVFLSLAAWYAIDLNGDIQRMSGQVQANRDSINRLENELSHANDLYESDTKSLQEKIVELIIKIQEQASRIQFLEKQLNKTSP